MFSKISFFIENYIFRYLFIAIILTILALCGIFIIVIVTLGGVLVFIRQEITSIIGGDRDGKHNLSNGKA